MPVFNPDPYGLVPEAQKGFALYQYALSNKLTILAAEIYETPKLSRMWTDGGELVYHERIGVQVLSFLAPVDHK